MVSSIEGVCTGGRGDDEGERKGKGCIVVMASLQCEGL